MNYEAGPGGQPEYFERAQNLEEVLREYNAAAYGLVEAHGSDLLHAFDSHDVVMRDERRHPGSQNVQRQIDKTESVVKERLARTGTDVMDLVHAAAKTIPPMLNEEDQRLLRQVKMAATQGGIESPQVNQLLSQGSSRTARAAMRAAMDARVLLSFTNTVLREGNKSKEVQSVLSHASTSYIRSAIRATHDATIFEAVKVGVDSIDAIDLIIPRQLKHKVVRDVLDEASSYNVRVGMMAGLDAALLHKVNTTNVNGRFYPNLTKEILLNASSRSTRKVLRHQAEQHTQQQGFTFNPFDFEGFDNLNMDDILVNALIREMLRNRAAGGQQGANTFGGFGNQRTGTFTAQEAPTRRPATEVDRVVSHVVTQNRRYSWLQSEQPEDIKRVINTVRKMRQSAVDQGKTLSDPKVYRKYRMKSDRDPDNPRLKKSVEILDALMLGDFKGQLPF